jgi:predicted RNase H-like nuclease (RuvC/YqgF family)
MRYLIVGVDVGTTSALAALDFEGGLVKVSSFRNAGVDEIVEEIRVLGIPAIVASDVSPPPKVVAKVATSFGANLFVPQESLTVEEKIELTREFDCGNPHERDALAAALNAHKKVKNLLIKADSLGLTESKKYAILQGDRIKDRLEKKVKEASEKPKYEQRVFSPEEERIRSLEKQVSSLARNLSEKRAEASSLKEERILHRRNLERELSKESEVRRLKDALRNRGLRITRLEEELASLSQFRFLWNKMIDGVVVPVGLFPQKNMRLTFIPNKIRENEREYLEDTKIAFTDNPANRKLLEEKGIPCLNEKLVRRFQGCFYVDAKTLAQEKTTVSIEELIDEYRKKRNGELRKT